MHRKSTFLSSADLGRQFPRALRREPSVATIASIASLGSWALSYPSRSTTVVSNGLVYHADGQPRGHFRVGLYNRITFATKD